MELLTPTGGMEQLRYALHFGADAVYLAGDQFGMRARADNFPGVELASGIALAHSYGKKAYVAANTLVHQGDLQHFTEFALSLEDAKADAAIVSDLAAIKAMKRYAPSVDIHISTQCSIVNADSANAYYEMGAKRVVLARELTLDEIAAIRANVPSDLELEVFVHGAMCIAYSGRCLISDYLVGRDANRGNCTQPCRWKWSLQEETRPGEYFPIEENGGYSFILSSADLNMLEHVAELEAAGVDSLKIEGRVKGAAYVATVTNAYRRVLDGADPTSLLEELDTISHRPYHTGFYFGVPAQSYDGEEYTQTCDFVGGVKSSAQLPDGRYRISFVLRNRIYRDNDLEILTPDRGVVHVRAAELADDEGMPCAIALHNTQEYSFACEEPFKPLDLIRKRRSDSSIQAGR